MHRWRGEYFLLLAAFLPGLLFIFLDRAVWDWDRAAYGYRSIMYHVAQQDGTWLWFMLKSGGEKAPLIQWIGQWFLYLPGSFEQTEIKLLLSVWLSVVLAGYFTYRAVVNLIGRGWPALTVIPIMAGMAGVIFCWQSYMTEGWQVLSVSLALWLFSCGERMTVVRWLTCAAFISMFGLLAKVSLPLYIGPLLLFSMIKMFVYQKGQKKPSWYNARDFVWAMPVAVFVAAGVIWYVYAFQDIFRFAVRNVYGDLGVSYSVDGTGEAGLLERVRWWLSTTHQYLLTDVLLFVLGAGLAGLVFGFKRVKFPARLVLSAILLTLVLCFTVFFSATIAMSRALIPLAPMVAFLIVLIIQAQPYKWARVLLGIMVVGQFILSHVGIFAGDYVPGEHGPRRSIDLTGSTRACAEKIARTYGKKDLTPITVGLQRFWMSGMTLTFYSSKYGLGGHDPVYFGTFQPSSEPDRSFAKIMEKFAIDEPLHVITLKDDLLQVKNFQTEHEFDFKREIMTRHGFERLANECEGVEILVRSRF